MKKQFSLNAVVHLVPGYRVHWEDIERCHVLLYPQGMVMLDIYASEVLRRCDDVNTVRQIIKDIKIRYPGVEVESQILEFLEDAESRGWIYTT